MVKWKHIAIGRKKFLIIHDDTCQCWQSSLCIIHWFIGENNSCYLPESTLTTLNIVKEAHPDQDYSRIVISDHGHLDCIFGKEASLHVFPYILETLDRYAGSLRIWSKSFKVILLMRGFPESLDWFDAVNLNLFEFLKNFMWSPLC